uniref:BP74 N-terminal domain-containing protein n=1 Tax=Chromera velia CCMP2878 TaxID=1169474 RepID=A0A0G4F9E1_9ALVE|eukprot:Cvel_181.t1-p1 / transcript=Cvel_181.t1 / gene=Cvel_181 / organism=Chromera_velia_CCMP2878 / gene_product=Cyclic AMP-inducible protein BP74, putative / transcript_product=Cyclic AMP-inducible protein BP74, putative / location=Cvel_scaffold11:81822-83101(-) / protein_length=218 / sequence_SO=supercontig / SO=protein_coding / is_pseudo=false
MSVLWIWMAVLGALSTASADPISLSVNDTSNNTSRTPVPVEAHFAFTDSTQKLFVFRLVDEEKIREAREILQNQGSVFEETRHVMGRVENGTVSYNPDWSFHLAEDSILFFEMAVEVCDANMQFVEDGLSEVGTDFLPNRVWCPWSSRLVAEMDCSRPGFDGTGCAVVRPGPRMPSVYGVTVEAEEKDTVTVVQDSTEAESEADGKKGNRLLLRRRVR